MTFIQGQRYLRKKPHCKPIIMTQTGHPVIRTNRVVVTAKISNCSNSIKVSSINNKANSNNKMTNPAYNYNT